MSKVDSITQSHNQKIAETDKRLYSRLEGNFFDCKQVKSKRSPSCTGRGYQVGKREGICSVCLGVGRE